MKTYTKVVNVIKETNDYGQFKKLRGNREIRNDELLMQSLKTNGQRQPILVNRKYEVIDGQHRLSILEKLGMPVKFIVDDTYELEHVVTMNNTQKNWSLEQYMNFHADNGKEEYIKVRNFYKDNDLSLRFVILAGAGARFGTADVTKKFKDKTGLVYSFSNQLELESFNRFYKEFLDVLKISNTTNMCNALWTIYTSNNFDGKRLIEKVDPQKGSNFKDLIYGAQSAPVFLDALVSTYNKSLSINSKYYIENFRDAKGSLILPR